MNCAKWDTCSDFTAVVDSKANVKILKETPDLNLKYPTEKQAINASDKQIGLWWLYHPTYTNRSEEEQKAMIVICSRFSAMPDKQTEGYLENLHILDDKIIEAPREEYYKYFYEKYPDHWSKGSR